MLHKGTLQSDYLVKVACVSHLVDKYFPGTFEHLYHDIVVDVGDEMNHLVSQKITAVQIVADYLQRTQLVLICHML